jgi:hypothetical protein
VDLVHFAVADVDKRRDIAAQIEQRMQLHRGLGCAKGRPRTYRQAKVDGRGITAWPESRAGRNDAL